MERRRNIVAFSRMANSSRMGPFDALALALEHEPRARVRARERAPLNAITRDALSSAARDARIQMPVQRAMSPSAWTGIPAKSGDLVSVPSVGEIAKMLSAPVPSCT